MSYTIHARGVRRFARRASGMTTGEVISMGEALNRCTAFATGGAAALAQSEAEGAAEDMINPTPGVFDLLQRGVNMEGRHVFGSSINALIARKFEVRLAVHAHYDPLIGFDKSGFCEVWLDGTFANPGRHFIQCCWPALEETELACGNVLADMANIIWDYSEFDQAPAHAGHLILTVSH